MYFYLKKFMTSLDGIYLKNIDPTWPDWLHMTPIPASPFTVLVTTSTNKTKHVVFWALEYPISAHTITQNQLRTPQITNGNPIEVLVMY